MAASDPERRKSAQPNRVPRSALASLALALPALAGTTGQLLLGLIAVVILILGLVSLLRCHKKDIPAVIRALVRMAPRDDDSGKGPPSLPKP